MPVEEIVRLDGLEVHFPIRKGIIDTLTGRPSMVIRAVDGIDLSLNRGEVLASAGRGATR